MLGTVSGGNEEEGRKEGRKERMEEEYWRGDGGGRGLTERRLSS